MVTVSSGTATFRPRARLIRLLGDELISDEVMAVVELVKNSYDADASEVIVAIDSEPGSRIEVRDNGTGMDLDTLLHSWLEPATDHKRRHGRKQRTPLGRYPLGEKGVGRFAAAKLGEELNLVTRCPGEEREISLDVLWDRYGESGYLDEVTNAWEIRDPLTFPGSSHGTLVRAIRPRDTWDAARITNLRDGLARLVSPFSHTRDFRITLRCAGYPELSGPVTGSLLDGAPYRLAGTVDARGQLHPEFPAGPAVDLLARAPERFLDGNHYRLPECGPFHIAFFVWDLGVGAHHTTVDRQVRDALRRTSGVSLYRDGFRVWPYGGPGDDWLELNQRRVNNPSLRVSTNQIIGIVEIKQTANPELRDRTSREGLIDTPALHDLRALLVGSLSVLEEQRFARRHEIADTAAEEEPDPVLRMMRQARGRAGSGEGTAAMLDRMITEYRRQLKVRDDREERLMRMADIGLAAGQVMSQISRTVATSSTALRFARTLADQTEVPEQIPVSLDRLQANLSFLERQMRVMDLLYDHPGTPASERVDVRTVVEQAATIYFNSLHRGGITLHIEDDGRLLVRIPPVHLLQIVLHLLENSIYWLTTTALDRQPEIVIRIRRDPPELLFADNGRGVPEPIRHLIFQPYFSTREGKGLGLHVVQNLMERSGYSVELLEESAIHCGANFRLSFSRTA